MNNFIYIFSLITGECFKLPKDELKTLFSYQIPLTTLPKDGCKWCYGRGYDTIDSRTGVYNMCRCLQKHILPEFNVSKVKVILPNRIENLFFLEFYYFFLSFL